MNAEYTALLKQDGDWWIGWIEEVPGVNCQERTKADLLASLKEVLAEAIEFNRQEALTAVGKQFSRECVALSAASCCVTCTATVVSLFKRR